MTNKELENKIYDTFYELNPDGDARFGLWPDVVDAKKSDNPQEALQALLSEVENGGYW